MCPLCPPGSYIYARQVKHCSKQQVWCQKTTYFHPHIIMNRCYIWNYDPIMINTSVPLCDGPAWCHDYITHLFLPLLSCRSSTRPAGPCSGPPSPPPLLTLLSQFLVQVTMQPSITLYSISEVSVRVWECGGGACVCLHVSVWRGRENWAIYLSSHKSVLKIYSP